ncbi:DNA cytosine methyltransferase [Streptomyces apricus]|uniref:DNA cytosine methyltransferase n=1 Tax=Streptomyces apricus TaxID=1828112 RepID=UPI00165EE60E|nr:DNA cytosine methyltransferase [Streptomyces apricus]
MTLTLTDLFCGAGGSSTGAAQVPGVQVAFAANHARDAIDSHQANHPEADHDLADISEVEPTRYPKTDLLWASPACTAHSFASGKKLGHGEYVDGVRATSGIDEAAIKSRATMWDCVRFAETHQYRAIIVENVVEVMQWGPPKKPGAVFKAWLDSMRAWGYEHRLVFLNSMFAQALGEGAPQSRDRFYAIFWRTGDRAPDFDKWLRPQAECPQHGRVQVVQRFKRPDRQHGKFRAQYTYACPYTTCELQALEPKVRSAAEAIDWTLPAKTLGERKRPLAESTLRRIRAGYQQFATSDHLLVPVEGRQGKVARPAHLPLRTCTTRNETGLALREPYMVELRGGNSSHRSIKEPLAAVCAGGNHHGLVQAPAMTLPYYSGSKARPASEPLGTVTTLDRHAVLPGGEIEHFEDLRFRMLEPSEYARAMALPEGYVLTPKSKRNRVKLIGNGVTPPAARDLVAMVTEAITGESIELPEPAPCPA